MAGIPAQLPSLICEPFPTTHIRIGALEFDRYHQIFSQAQRKGWELAAESEGDIPSVDLIPLAANDRSKGSCVQALLGR
jgi:hypothetical protein